jgi:hypothetical protein
MTLIVPAATTAIISPLIFAAVRRIESLAARRREEKPATA